MKRNGYNPAIVRAWFLHCGLPEPELEYQFHPTRKWRFDVAWPVKQIAVEVQGGIWNRGRHNRGAAMLKEWEKLNMAALLGWRIFYTQPQDLCTSDFADILKLAWTNRLKTVVEWKP